MDVRLIEDRRLWNLFVAGQPTGHLCQTFEWPEHGEDLDARKHALHVGIMEGDRLVGALALSQSRVRGITQPLYYAPRGPVVADPDGPVLPLLMRGAAALARRAGGCAIRIEPNVLDGDVRWMRALRALGYHPTTHTIYHRNVWVLDIRPSESELLAGMKEKWRYNIRLAGRKGVTVRAGTTEADLDVFYALHTDTSQRQGFYLYPKHVFRDMLAHYSPEAAARDATAEMRLLIADYQGEPISAITVARFGTWAWYLHGASGTQHRNVMPNHLLQWTAIQWAKANGVEFYDFRGIPETLEQGREMFGVYEFKRGFGGFVRRVMPTMDYVISPLQYYPYHLAVDLRRRLAQRRSHEPAPVEERA
jgi:peptidoglycan pentaglycine glycine transferase (the first glycine)